jgi:hypothetical protein
MKQTIRTALFALAAVALVPALSLAGPAQGGTGQKAPAKTTAAPVKAATHAVAGVVTSVDANALVITTAASSKEKGKELTFVLNASTQKKGTIAAGAAVDVRYQTEGGKNVATAVTVQTKKK